MADELATKFEDLHAIDPNSPRKCEALVGFLKIVAKMIKDKHDFADADAEADFRAIVERAIQ